MPIRILIILLGLVGLVAATGKIFESQTAAARAHTSYYANGQKKEQTQFVAGRRQGHTLRWYPDGTLKAEGDFRAGKMEGDWSWHTPQGQTDEGRSGHYERGLRLPFSQS